MSPRVLVVGAGPAGLYAAATLAAADVGVDVADRLPTPYGLVRYGVAPDHPKIKSVTRVLARPFSAESVRFLGNVTVGVDLTVADIRGHYDAVVYATGAARGLRPGVPGDDLPGSAPAADFVAWYGGHPDAVSAEELLDARRIAVIGAGNVALDTARMLLKDARALADTELPDAVLAALSRSRVTDVHLIARRGPARAKFTPVELRELGELGVDVLVRPDDLEPSADEAGVVAGDRAARTNVEILREWAGRPGGDAARRLHLWFRTRLVEVCGRDRVDALLLEPGGERLPVDAVLYAIGHRGTPLLGLPFDEVTGTVPHERGRVLGVPGAYVAGWLKRGATGVIGTNKADAGETVASLLADLPGLPRPAEPDPAAVTALLERRGVRPVTWAGWTRLDAHEAELGRRQGRARAKITDLPAMLAICG
ncbi:FAD-dependent oxidoreductase [Umezawaea endophytica]|uniref:ferredoxin--NADP(+) reductase n=1 Tax=Umezawaea endophytica TaxID=1654476 RepID=A0A9X2VWS9_9PSEU|nr:FAD-dependent oxidoreductase [Umezawaea endophytica]MCS7484099.1 FAD-dependent oxidoreductase [Umezawaea endophytica]